MGSRVGWILGAWGGGWGAQKGSSWQRPLVSRGLLTKCLLSRPGRVTGNTKDTAKKVILNLIVPVPFVKCLQGCLEICSLRVQ